MDKLKFEFGPFVLDRQRKSLAKNGMLLQPGQRAIALLEVLLDAGGKPVSKADLMDAVWPDSTVEESNLTVQVAALRKIMGPAPDGGEWIITVQRMGYQLVLPQPHPAAMAPSMDGSAVEAKTGKPSIAVLPFDNMSPDPSQEFFADGITEDLTTALSRLKGFFVIARNTMFTYKGKPVNIRNVGQELGVRYLLEGSVRSAGGRIRISTQLIDASSGNHIWGERYDRSTDDLFAIQDEITTSVAARISSELLMAEHERTARKPPTNLDAWECFVRAVFLVSRLSEEDSREAMLLLERAIASDPNYAQALGLIAFISTWRAAQGWDERTAAFDRTRDLGTRAIAADDREPWAWIGHGTIGLGTRDSRSAISSFERAIELNPNFAMAHGLTSLAYSFAGQATEAIRHLDEAMRLSPREVFQGAYIQQYAFAHFQGADYAKSLEYARRAHQLRPGHVYPMIIGAASAGYLGDKEEAAVLIRSLKATLPHATASWIETTVPYVLPEDRARLAHGLRLAGLD
jgi:TolB-like protein